MEVLQHIQVHRVHTVHDALAVLGSMAHLMQVKVLSVLPPRLCVHMPLCHRTQMHAGISGQW